MPAETYSVYLLPGWAPFRWPTLIEVMDRAFAAHGGSFPCLLCDARCGPKHARIGTFVVVAAETEQARDVAIICQECGIENLVERVFEKFKADMMMSDDARMLRVYHQPGHA